MKTRKQVSKRARITNRQYMEAAKRIHEVEGEVEVDISSRTQVSRSTANTDTPGEGDGAYVQAWVWVPAEEALPAELEGR